MSNKIGKYFTLDELTVTTTGLNNIPMQSEKENLVKLVDNILDPLRELYGKPIHINSGYRSPLVNKKIGGAATSQHVRGQAVDITGGSKEENLKLFNLIVKNFKFDQIIFEKGDSKGPDWVHVSFSSTKNRGEKLKFNGKSYIKI